MIEHVSLRCRNSKQSQRFYTRALKPLGYTLSKKYGDAFGYQQGGRHDFWVTQGEVGTPTHVAFHAADRKSVDAFYKAALQAGGKDNGEPGERKDYGGYAAFVYDPDGHNIEAVIWDEDEAARPASKSAQKRTNKSPGKAARKAPAKKARK